MNLNSLGETYFFEHLKIHENSISEHTRVVQVKFIKGFFWVKMWLLLKMVPISAEAGIHLTHQPVDQLPGLLLKSLHHRGLVVFTSSESTALQPPS
jgi:hypothetical protein